MQNPYEATTEGVPAQEWSPKSKMRWALVGFVIACAPIAGLGVFGLYAEVQYSATLPPDTRRCGNGAMAAMLLIFPISQVFGCIGGFVGFISAVIFNASHSASTHQLSRSA